MARVVVLNALVATEFFSSIPILTSSLLQYSLKKFIEYLYIRTEF